MTKVFPLFDNIIRDHNTVLTAPIIIHHYTMGSQKCSALFIHVKAACRWIPNRINYTIYRLTEKKFRLKLVATEARQ